MAQLHISVLGLSLICNIFPFLMTFSNFQNGSVFGEQFNWSARRKLVQVQC